MPTITVKLDRERASRLSQWARRRNISKSEVIRGLIDSAGPIETGRDSAAWVAASEGKDLGFGRRRE
jgi:predicted transcriptional regulator